MADEFNWFTDAEADVERAAERILTHRHKATTGECAYCDRERAAGNDFHPSHDASPRARAAVTITAPAIPASNHWSMTMLEPSPNEIMKQHLGWIKLYVEMMMVDNWRDMKLRIERQAAEAIDLLKTTQISDQG